MLKSDRKGYHAYRRHCSEDGIGLDESADVAEEAAEVTAENAEVDSETVIEVRT
jgi:hypothetical protein